MEINERVAKVETRVESLEERATIHGRELDEMRIRNAEQDAQLKKLCVNQERAYELAEKSSRKLDKMSAQADTAAWMLKAVVYGVPALFTLYLTFKQMGWF